MPRRSRSSSSPSPATLRARERNFAILRLRGMFANFYALEVSNLQVFTPAQIKAGQKLINEALTQLGAEPEGYKRYE